MDKPILLCCDLDRTVLPNGMQAESPQARPLFRRLAARPEITLVYVSGRHKALLQQAIEDYDIPFPDYAIGDVGTTIYSIENRQWHAWNEWEQDIATDWNGHSRQQLAQMLTDIKKLNLQENEKQNSCKLSYYAPENSTRDELIEAVQQRLTPHGIQASIIWSIDEARRMGLLDILPRRATKLHAIEFLMQRKGFEQNRTVFAGDSGNDLPVLTSGLQAILVRNAHNDVAQEAMRTLTTCNMQDTLYLAQGGFYDMNGNYAAGVLEGLAHYFPETAQWLQQ